MRTVLLVVAIVALATAANADWKPYKIKQLNGPGKWIDLTAQLTIPTEATPGNAVLPYMIYMPEKDRLLMTIGMGNPMAGMVISSSTRGATWTAPRTMGVDANGKPFPLPVGLSYMGGGVCAAGMEPSPNAWISRDYGATWADSGIKVPSIPGAPMYAWDPVLVDRDPKTREVTQLTLAMYRQEDPEQLYSSQGYIFTSTDEGKTWTGPKLVPQWKNVNEIAFVRAKNGDIVAACRTDNPQRFWGGIDHYCGLSTSVSKDNGLTWSPLYRLYEIGRHHPSMVVLKDGTIVMSYIVRIGYTPADDGYPRFGVEAIVSKDNGKTWDLDHKFVLASWKGSLNGAENWYHPAPQCSTSVLLPGETILTAFTAGDHAARPGRTVYLVRWKPNFKGLNRSGVLKYSQWDTDTRNQFDPGTLLLDK